MLSEHLFSRRSFGLGAIMLSGVTTGHGQTRNTAANDATLRLSFINRAMRVADLEHDAWTEKTRAELAKQGRYPTISARPTLTPFADWDFYYVNRGSIVWRPNEGQFFAEVIVPDGFVTDLASIPRAFWIVLRPEGRHAYAAVIHDYLYWKQDRSRVEADLIFKTALEDSNVRPALVYSLYHSVRRFGAGAWEKNAKLKLSGEKRFLKQKPAHFNVTWRDWKNRPGVFDVTAPDQEVPPVKSLRRSR